MADHLPAKCPLDLGYKKSLALSQSLFGWKNTGYLVVYQIISQHVEPHNPSGPHGPMVMVPTISSTWASNWPWNKATKPTKMIVQGNKHVVLSSNTGTKLVWNSASKLPYIASHEKSNSWSSTYQILYDQSSHGGFPFPMGVPQAIDGFSDGTS